jgi:hypothetical protein
MGSNHVPGLEATGVQLVTGGVVSLEGCRVGTGGVSGAGLVIGAGKFSGAGILFCANDNGTTEINSRVVVDAITKKIRTFCNFLDNFISLTTY